MVDKIAKNDWRPVIHGQSDHVAAGIPAVVPRDTLRIETTRQIATAQRRTAIAIGDAVSNDHDNRRRRNLLGDDRGGLKRSDGLQVGGCGKGVPAGLAECLRLVRPVLDGRPHHRIGRCDTTPGEVSGRRIEWPDLTG